MGRSEAPRYGVTVIGVDQVKGLEFDFVVLPDVDDDQYPDRPDARRALYVAATRALAQLWVATCGKRPGFVRKALA